MAREFEKQSLCRPAIGLAAALLCAGGAAAQDFSDWRWTRTDTPGGVIWIASRDLPAPGARPAAATVRVLWRWLPVRAPLQDHRDYSIVEYRFRCSGRVENTIWTFNRDGSRLPPAHLPDREATVIGVEGTLFSILCKGKPALTDIEVGTTREALDYDDMAKGRGWNRGSGR